MIWKSVHKILVSQKPLHIFSGKFTFSLNIINTCEYGQKGVPQPADSRYLRMILIFSFLLLSNF